MQQLRHHLIISIVAAILLLIILAGFQALPVFQDNSAEVVNDAGLQRTRCQIIAKSVYVLAYRPKAEHAQAVSDLQTTLPLWQQEQENLTSSVTSDVLPLLQDARSNYLAIAAATKAILAQPDQSPDPIQIDIVANSNRDYTRTMNQVNILLVRQAEIRERGLLFFESLIDLIVLSLAVVALVRVLRARTREA